MILNVSTDDGETIAFESADRSSSSNKDILRGRTYPYFPFVDDVQVVFDVGANCGAAALHFARHYPAAAVHAFEPAADAYMRAERNLAGYPNAHLHRFGLDAVDRPAPIERRAAGAWCREEGIARIDIVKLDVDGLEADVLASLEPFLPTVKVCYLEYHSRATRRRIRDLISSTHELYAGQLFLDQGDIVYLRKDVADFDVATQWLREGLAASLDAPAAPPAAAVSERDAS